MHIDERAGGGGLPLAELQWVAAQLTLALEAMHAMEMIHRDIKPSNVIMDRHGYWALSDFGLSSRLGVSSCSGTRGFWSPETVRRETQHPTADWWSCGVTLWFAACGKHPFHRRCREVEGKLVWPPLPVRTDEAEDVPAPASGSGGGGSGGGGSGGGDDGDDAVAEGGEDDDVGAARGEKARAVAVDRAEDGLTATAAAPAAEEAEGAAWRSKLAVPKVDERGGSRKARRFTEEELNFSTIYMPIDTADLAPRSADLASFLGGLLERDARRRLGAAGVAEVHAHPFLGRRVEWELLRQRKLPAPWTPDPGTVYTRDRIADYSGDCSLPSSELCASFADWPFTSAPEGYAEELCQFVQKSSTRAILHAMKAPETELAKLEAEPLPRDAERDEKDVHSEEGSLESRQTLLHSSEYDDSDDAEDGHGADEE